MERDAHDFGFTFDGEAGEIFHRLIRDMEGYGVTVTTQTGEVVKGFIAPLPETQWYDEIAVLDCKGDWDKSPEECELRRVLVGDVRVH